MAEMNGRKFSSSGSGGKESGDALKNIKEKQGEINDNVYRCYEALCDLRTKKLDLDEDKESDRKMLDQVNAHRNTFQNSLLQLSGAVTNMLQNSRKNSRNLKKYKFQNLELEKELDEVRDELRNAEFRTPEDANDESAREKRKEKAKSAMTKLVLRNLEKKLNDSEARILMYKYGLRDYSSPHTTGEVCAEFDQTATYVNNLERAFCETMKTTPDQIYINLGVKEYFAQVKALERLEKKREADEELAKVVKRADISEGFPDYGQLDEFDQKHVLDWRTGLPKFFFGIPALVDTNIHLRNTLMSYGWDLLGCKHGSGGLGAYMSPRLVSLYPKGYDTMFGRERYVEWEENIGRYDYRTKVNDYIAIHKFQVKSGEVKDEEAPLVRSRRGTSSAFVSKDIPVKFSVDSDLDILEHAPVVTKYIKTMVSQKGSGTGSVRQRYSELHTAHSKETAALGSLPIFGYIKNKHFNPDDEPIKKGKGDRWGDCVAFIFGEIRGFIDVDESTGKINKMSAEVYGIWVSPVHRKKGLGSSLVSWFEKSCKSISFKRGTYFIPRPVSAMTDNEDAHPDAFEPERKPVVYMHTYNGADKFLKACGYGITGKAAWKKISLRHMVDIPEGTLLDSRAELLTHSTIEDKERGKYLKFMTEPVDVLDDVNELIAKYENPSAEVEVEEEEEEEEEEVEEEEEEEEAPPPKRKATKTKAKAKAKNIKVKSEVQSNSSSNANANANELVDLTMSTPEGSVSTESGDMVIQTQDFELMDDGDGGGSSEEEEAGLPSSSCLTLPNKENKNKNKKRKQEDSDVDEDEEEEEDGDAIWRREIKAKMKEEQHSSIIQKATARERKLTAKLVETQEIERKKTEKKAAKEDKMRLQEESAICTVCLKDQDDSVLIFCDQCNERGAQHTYCCTPSLEHVPLENEIFFCDKCCKKYNLPQVSTEQKASKVLRRLEKKLAKNMNSSVAKKRKINRESAIEEKAKLTDFVQNSPKVQEAINVLMSDCLEVIESDDVNSMFFNTPVDPVEFGLIDYFDVVKNPMDFTTIRGRIDASIYTDISAFHKDMSLVFSNGYLYNDAPDNPIHKSSKLLEGSFASLYSKLVQDIALVLKKHHEQHEQNGGSKDMAIELDASDVDPSASSDSEDSEDGDENNKTRGIILAELGRFTFVQNKFCV